MSNVGKVDAPKRQTLVTQPLCFWAFLLVFLSSAPGNVTVLAQSETAPASSKPQQAPFHLETNIFAGYFVSNDQNGYLGMNSAALGLDLAVEYRVPDFPLRAGLRSINYFASAPRGAIGALFGGELSIGTDIRLTSNLRVPLHIAGGVGFTGGLVRPVSELGVGLETALNGEFWAGARVLYSHVFQDDGLHATSGRPFSDDAMMLSLALSLSIEPTPATNSVVVHEQTQTVHTASEVHVVRRESTVERFIEIPPATPAELTQSRQLLDLALAAMPGSSEVRILPPILFAFDSDVLTPAGEVALLDALQIIREALVDAPANSRIEIEGHADSNGTSEHNDSLARQRAEHVARWLREHQIPEAVLSVRSYGENNVLEHADSARADEMSRRVIIHIVRGAE